MRNKKMKIKWEELTEDDPIFRQGFIISNPSLRHGKNQKSDIKQIKEDYMKKKSYWKWIAFKYAKLNLYK